MGPLGDGALAGDGTLAVGDGALPLGGVLALGDHMLAILGVLLTASSAEAVLAFRPGFFAPALFFPPFGRPRLVPTVEPCAALHLSVVRGGVPAARR